MKIFLCVTNGFTCQKSQPAKNRSLLQKSHLVKNLTRQKSHLAKYLTRQKSHLAKNLTRQKSQKNFEFFKNFK